MFAQRKLECERCGSFTNKAQCFPSNTRRAHQFLWVKSLGLDPDQSAAKLEELRSRRAVKADIWWCELHFDDSGMPIQAQVGHDRENGGVPVIEEKRRRVDQQDVVVHVEGDEGDGTIEGREHDNMDMADGQEMGENDQPYHSDTETVVPDEYPMAAPLSVSQLVLDADEPAKKIAQTERIESFQSQSSVPTLGVRSDSSFRLSNVSQSQSDSEQEEDEEDSVRSAFFITAKSQLEMLFRRCQECGGLIDPTSLTWKQKASALWVTYHCTECKQHLRWDSQQKGGRGQSKLYELNQTLPVAAFTTGTPIPRISELCALLSIAFPSERSMRDIIRFYVLPAIDRVYARWEKEARQLSKDTAPKEGLVVSIDGQYQDPGHTSTLCKVTAFDSVLGLIIAGETLHVNDPGIEGVSCRMESVGTEKVLVDLVEDGFKISTRVTDSNAMVDKRVRENPKLVGIKAMRDFWHVQKPLRRLWWTGMKKANCPNLSEWYRPFIDHIYWVNQRFPKSEDRPYALELVQSFLLHCMGKHEWEEGELGLNLVTKCSHEVKRAPKRGRKGKKGVKGGPVKAPKTMIEENSPEYQLIHSMLFNASFAKKFLACSPDIGTSICESFHSMSLMYSPKRFPCSHPYFNRKTKMAYMHNNSLVYGSIVGDRVEVGNSVLPRKGRIALAVKRKMNKGVHPWREEILEECWALRGVYADNRLLKRLGAPDDVIFDEINAIYDTMEIGGESGDEEEWDGEISDEY